MDDEAELEGELCDGAALARTLVAHMLKMGADACILPVLVEDEKYEVSIKRIPV